MLALFFCNCSCWWCVWQPCDSLRKILLVLCLKCLAFKLLSMQYVQGFNNELDPMFRTTNLLTSRSFYRKCGHCYLIVDL